MLVEGLKIYKRVFFSTQVFSRFGNLEWDFFAPPPASPSICCACFSTTMGGNSFASPPCGFCFTKCRSAFISFSRIWFSDMTFISSRRKATISRSLSFRFSEMLLRSMSCRRIFSSSTSGSISWIFVLFRSGQYFLTRFSNDF